MNIIPLEKTKFAHQLLWTQTTYFHYVDLALFNSIVMFVSHFLERRNWERVCIQSLRVHRDDSTEHLGLHLGDIALVQPRHIPSHYSVLRKRLHWRIILAFLFKRIHFQGRISRIMTIKENTRDYFLLLCKHELIKLCNATLAVPW